VINYLDTATPSGDDAVEERSSCAPVIVSFMYLQSFSNIQFNLNSPIDDLASVCISKPSKHFETGICESYTEE